MAISELDYCKLLPLKNTKLTGQLIEMFIEDNLHNELMLKMLKLTKFNDSRNIGRNLDGKKLIKVRDKAVVHF
jgi:hypothetical protein